MASALTSASFGAFLISSQSVLRLLAFRKSPGARQGKHRDHVGEVVRFMVFRIHRHHRTPGRRTDVRGRETENKSPLSFLRRPSSVVRYANRIEDSRLRPATVASSVGPQASK